MCIELNHDFSNDLSSSSRAELGQFNYCIISLVGYDYPELLLRMKKWYCFIQKLALI